MPNTMLKFQISFREFSIGENFLSFEFNTEEGIYSPFSLLKNLPNLSPEAEATAIKDNFIKPLQQAEADFLVHFPSIEPSIKNIKVADLKNSIAEFSDKHTYVGLFLGLQNPLSSSKNRIILFFRGVTLKNENLLNGPSRADTFTKHFSTDNFELNTNTDRIEKCANFLNETAGQNTPPMPLGKKNMIIGSYIKKSAFKKMLKDFEDKDIRTLTISFGYQLAVINTFKLDWDCLQLIIRGSNSEDILYSTLKGESGILTGPKLGCPPLGTPEE